MGILHLTSYISPYAVTTVLGCDKPACSAHSSLVTSRSKVVIDGPAFAYEVYNRLTAFKVDRSDALAVVPSYDEVGRAALAYLAGLEKHSIFIDKVYFDGFLPAQKAETRIARLQKQVNRLSAFQSLHQHGFCNVAQIHVIREVEIADILTSNRSRALFRDVPAAPFFVAAVLEAIGDSKYASITDIVPGEAETYCAARARQCGGLILSNDSDLLIYDLGPDGAVGSLTSLEAVIHDAPGNSIAMNSCHIVQTTVIKPRDVARILGLQSLQNLAYVLKVGPEVPFQKAIKQAQSIKLSDIWTHEVLREYQIEPAAFESSMFHPKILDRVRAQAPFLDPRVSEFVLQSDKERASLYLPVTIEDPDRMSAFIVSTPNRTLAYSCCTYPYNLEGCEVLEYGRKGQHILTTSIKLLATVDILKHAKALCKRLQLFTTDFSPFSRLLIWRVYALAEVYHWYLDTGRTPPSRDAMATALTGKVQGRVTWDDIHLNAQIEASLYSLRMIQQILGFVLPFDANDESETSMIETLVGLKENLKALPPLKHLMPNRYELMAQTADVDVEELLNCLASILQDDIGREARREGADGEGRREGERGEKRADGRRRKRKKMKT